MVQLQVHRQFHARCLDFTADQLWGFAVALGADVNMPTTFTTSYTESLALKLRKFNEFLVDVHKQIKGGRGRLTQAGKCPTRMQTYGCEA
jgi:hypothetical protein